jgi:hypothetical protein
MHSNNYYNLDISFIIFTTLFSYICIFIIYNRIIIIYKTINNQTQEINNQILEINKLKNFIHNNIIELSKMKTFIHNDFIKLNNITTQLNHIYEEDIVCGSQYLTAYDNILGQYNQSLILIKFNKYITEIDISNTPLHSTNFINYKKLELFPNLTKIIYNLEDMKKKLPLSIFNNTTLPKIKHIVIKHCYPFPSICNFLNEGFDDLLFKPNALSTIEIIEINIDIYSRIYDDQIYVFKKYNLLKILPLLKIIKINIEYNILQNYYNEIITIIKKYKKIWDQELFNIELQITEQIKHIN